MAGFHRHQWQYNLDALNNVWISVFSGITTCNRVVYDLDTYKEEMDVEQITCLEEYGDHVRRQFPKKEIIYSYNNDLTREKITKIPKAFDTVVLG